MSALLAKGTADRESNRDGRRRRRRNERARKIYIWCPLQVLQAFDFPVPTVCIAVIPIQTISLRVKLNELIDIARSSQ